MTKAEEAALKAYPPLSVASVCLDGTVPVDLNTGARKRFVEGYEQAEKDLALTWEDIKTITGIADSMLTGTAWDVIDWPDEQKYYEEVLKRFKQIKED